MLLEVNSFVRNGLSLKKIARTLNLSKTTVYYHFRKIKGRTYSAPRINFPSEECRGEVLGIFAGDGSCFIDGNYHYVVRVHCGKDAAYAEYVKTIFSKCFCKKFWLHGPPNNLCVEISSKRIYHFFTSSLAFDPPKKASSIRLQTTKLSNSFLRGFLRGLVDTDAHISKIRRRIFFCTVSSQLAGQISDISLKLGFVHSRVVANRTGGNKDLHYIYILSSSINNFLSQVKPFHWAGRSTVDRMHGK